MLQHYYNSLHGYQSVDSLPVCMTDPGLFFYQLQLGRYILLSITIASQNYAHNYCNYVTVHIATQYYFNDYISMNLLQLASQTGSTPLFPIYAMLHALSYIRPIMLMQYYICILIRNLVHYFVPSWHNYYITQLSSNKDCFIKTQLASQLAISKSDFNYSQITLIILL